MRRVTDLTPKFSSLKPAEREFEVPYIAGDRPLGESAGGLALYSNKFKRGYGDKVFGSDENGIWLGAAEFADAPFSVDMEGNTIANAIELSSSVVIASANGLNQDVTTEADISGSSISFTLDVDSIVLIVVTVHGWIEGVGSSGNGLTRLYINGSEVRRCILTSSTLTGTATTYTGTLSAGLRTLKLTGVCDPTAGTPNFNIYNYAISLVTLGAVL